MRISWIGIRGKKHEGVEPYDIVGIRIEEDGAQIDVELDPKYTLEALLPLIKSALPKEIVS